VCAGGLCGMQVQALTRWQWTACWALAIGQLAMLTWLRLVLDRLDSQRTVSACYGVFFHFIDYDTLRCVPYATLVREGTGTDKHIYASLSGSLVCPIQAGAMPNSLQDHAQAARSGIPLPAAVRAGPSVWTDSASEAYHGVHFGCIACQHGPVPTRRP